MDQPAAPASPFRTRLRTDFSDLARLAWPVVVARAGLLVMALVDTIFVGRYGTADLAELSLASAVIGALIVIGIGLLTGTLVVVANALGRGAMAECGAAWLRSLPYSVVLGLGLGVLSLLAEPFFRATGQTPDMARAAARLMGILALGLPAGLVYTTSAYFLEGLKRPLPGMILMVLANGLNALLVWLLVYGHAGLPELGAAGSAWATTIVRILLAAGILLYIWRMPDGARLGVRRWPGLRWRHWRQQRRIGYGGGISVGLETGSFTALFLFAGQLGDIALAAYSIFMNLIALIFMVSLGVATATAVRVGVAHGRADPAEAARAAWLGLAVNTVIMLAIGLALVPLALPIATVYSRDPALIALSVPLIAFAATILMADGGQVVMLNASRGRHDVVVPTILHGLAYIGVMTPAAWLLAIALGRGVQGLAEAVLIASIVAVGGQSIRFGWLSRKESRRVHA